MLQNNRCVNLWHGDWALSNTYQRITRLCRIAVAPLLILAYLAFVSSSGCGRSATPRLVLYCSQDREYAEGILADFIKQTGIQIDYRGDTEADKSVSLYEALIREAEHPRCDVFWCNEPVLMQRLSQRGLLEPYASPAAAPFPPSSHPADHSWQAFAARARVLIVNKKLPEVDAPRSLSELVQPKWHHRFAMAKPFFGSTATHMACLWAKLGPEAAKGMFANLAAQAIVLPGNSNVAQTVADGKVEVGLTDTDDAMEMIDKGKPVRIAFLDQPEPGTLFLPNTLGLIKNAQHPDLGKKLIDFLLSPEVEKRLAEGPSAQIPLNPQVKLEKPRLTIPANIHAMQVGYAAAAQQWEDVQSALRQAFRE